MLLRIGLSLCLLSSLLIVGTGCKKRRPREQPKTVEPKPEPGDDKPGEGEGEDDGADDEGGGSGGSELFTVQDPERLKAMQEAMTSLIRGDESAVRRVLALGADRLEVLERAVESENVKAVSSSMKALAQLETNAKHTALIRQGLKHSAAGVRAEAADAAAASRAIDATPDVLELLKDDELELRATGCDALADLAPSDEAAKTAIFGRLSDSEDVVRASCSVAFAAIAKGEAWRNRVAELLLKDSADDREGALRVLSLWRDATAFDLIRGRLSDPNASVVAAALAAVAPFGDVATVREVERFVKDTRLSVRLEAVAALEQLPKDDVRPMMYEALKDREAVIRVEATSQLARYAEDPETLIRLHALLLDESIGVRDAAAIALQELADPRSFPPVLARLAEEPDELVRTDLVDALAKADKEKAVPHLIDRIDRATGRERTRIFVLLGELTGQELGIDQAKWRAWYAKKSAPQP